MEQKDVLVLVLVLDHKDIQEHQKLIQEQIEVERPSFYNKGYVITVSYFIDRHLDLG